MKTMKKRALLPAIAMVLVSVLALSGVSYAWFTTSTTAQVNDITLNVKAADGMQISLNAVNWKSIIPGSEISSTLAGYENNTNQIPGEDVVPVSSSCVIDGGIIPMYTGTYDDNGNLVTDLVADQKGTGAGRNYYAFDLFFNMSANKTLQLNVDSSVVSTTDTELAARVAFINFGEATTGADAQALSAGKEIKVWEPNAKMHTASVIAAGLAVNGTEYDYKGVNAESTAFDEKNGGEAVTTIKPTQDPETQLTTATADLFDFNAGINKVRVYIWLEGQDVDCINDISGNSFTVNLKFTQA